MDKKHIVHIHVPKTGGTWLNDTLQAYAPDHFTRLDNTHVPLDAAIHAQMPITPMKHVINGWKNVQLRYDKSDVTVSHPGKFEASWKVAIVRNPFDLLVSYYTHDVNPTSHFRKLRNFYKYDEDGLKSDLPVGWGFINLIHNIRSFDEFIRLFCDTEFMWMHTRYRDFLFYQMFYGSGKGGVDFIFRQERLHEATRAFLQFGGYIPEGFDIEDRRQNVSHMKKKDYREYYTDETRELVEKKCALELELFDYNFDGIKDGHEDAILDGSHIRRK
ncbi:MAG: sulfotransferase family 2 domain-containing protein [Candidatus Latescibacterota bacterium]|nr:sulfotransferase family 2 domain-containing protein [Candidatus Latescibacterota bacterium]